MRKKIYKTNLLQKNMKKTLLTAAVLLVSGVLAFAQDGKQSADVQLSVILNPIQTIEVGAATQRTVDLVYDSKEDYANGVEVSLDDHLTVYSTGGFEVKAQSATDNIQRANGSETISASTINVLASPGATNALTGANYNNVSLSTTPTNLISSSVGGVNKNFNVKYSGIGADGYLNSYYNDENPTVYTTTVTYSIVAQ